MTESSVTSIRRRIHDCARRLQSISEAGKRASDAAAGNEEIIYFRGMSDNLTKTFHKFDDLWDQLCDFQSSSGDTVAEAVPTKSDKDTKAAIERWYFTCNALLEQLKAKEASTHVSTNDFSLNQSRASRALPKIQLPTFDGALLSWPRFRDTYESIVHEDPLLSDTEKFHYLCTALTGPALSVIAHIPLEAQNYSTAWKAMMDYYNNNRRLATTYLDQIVNFKPLHGRASPADLQAFLSTVGDTVASFKLLKIPNEPEFVLFHLGIRCLDPATREAFEMAHKNEAFPTFNNLIDFVRSRMQALQLSQTISVASTSPNQNRGNSKPFKPSNSSRTSLLVQDKPAKSATSTSSASPPCPVCQSIHHLLKCEQYDQASASERHQLLKQWKGCLNCLSPHHSVVECKSKWTCRFCNKKHHSSLHIHKAKSATVKNSPNEDICSNVAAVEKHSSPVLLGTAVVEFMDSRGLFQPVRLVIDSGSQSSFMTARCLRRLGLPMQKAIKKIAGIGQTSCDNVKGVVHCLLRPCLHNGVDLQTDAIVIDNITSYLPTTTLPFSFIQACSKFQMADPQFWKPGPVDFLLGADLFSNIWNGQPTSLGGFDAKLFSTTLGNVVLGKVDSTSTLHTTHTLFTLDPPINNLHFELQKFWEIEEVNVSKPPLKPDDILCEQFFQDTHYRLPSGQYVVHLPFKSGPPQLGNPYKMASKRFYHIERRLANDKQLQQLYCDFMAEYLDLGHMEKATTPSKFLIPHHCVVKDTPLGKKIRVVFDASAHTDVGSLNEHLLTGEKLQTEIRDVILNFRRHPIVFTTDIVKMYRMILVDKSDRPFQHILWKTPGSDQLETYELCTVTYGQSCAPFLALRVIKQLVIDHGKEYPLAAEALTHDIYVDDILTGAGSIAEALTKKQQIIDLLSHGCFCLSKWASNIPELLQSLTPVISEPISLDDDNSCIKILGLQWDPQSDEFQFTTKQPVPTNTKRGILSTIARLYDPIGLLTPVTFLMKNFIQEIWKLSLDWDDSIPLHLQTMWDQIISELPTLNQLRIPRFVRTTNDAQIQIVGFADASEKGYAACLYIRTRNPRSEAWSTFLLSSKSKLAPLKTLTIPRLELSGALLLSQLYAASSKFWEPFSNNLLSPVFFTDSSIVIGWLHTPTYKLHVFVCNRVVKILELTSVHHWRHVSSADNPSDMGSRGLLPAQLIQSEQWWRGPAWLELPETSWPQSPVQLPNELPEIKHENQVLIAVDFPHPVCQWINRFSNYELLIRSSAWLQRWLHNIKHLKCCCCELLSGPLSLAERNSGLMLCIRATQFHHFHRLMPLEQTMKKFANLHPFVDADGILRVGGRLNNSTLPYSTRHPILLPYTSHFSVLIVDHYHRIHLHPSSATLQAFIQTMFWIPSLRRLIRSRGFMCIKCYRSRAAPVVPLMGDLPKCRVVGTRPFQHVGIDFAGPFLLKESNRRKAALGKVYLCLYVCMATKALHLEAVTKLSTEAFLASFNRFTARRGLPSHVYSDNGTNFQGASNYLKEIHQWFLNSDNQADVVAYVQKHQIKWHFNPPQTPHMGGIWEAGVKAVKGHIQKISGDTPLTFEEMSTLFARIEAILNSRPLCPLSTDPADTSYLCPGHFLVGGPLIGVPEPLLLDIRENLLSRWQLVQSMSQQFWNRWRQEYLATLQRRPKWFKATPNLKKDDMVLLKKDSPPMRWPAARVIETHPGKDGVVRVATIRTSDGSTYKRAATNLVPLLPLASPPYPMTSEI